MPRASLLIAACLGLALTGASAARTVSPHGLSADPRGSYFIDFRARGGSLLGHTFVVYGRMDAHGRLLEAHYAGNYPREDHIDVWMVPLLLVPKSITVKSADFRERPTAIYRRRLSAAEYVRVAATVRHVRATTFGWHLVLNNCNHFAAEVAHSIGLATPPTLQLPEGFVRGLSTLNER